MALLDRERPETISHYREPVGSELPASPKIALSTAGLEKSLGIRAIELKAKAQEPAKAGFNWGRLWLAACLLCAFGLFGRAAWHSSSSAPKPSIAAAAHSPGIKRIDSIVLGDNVLTEIDDHLREKAIGDVSLLPAEDQPDAKIDPVTSREIVLRAIDSDGSRHEFRFIKSLNWIDEAGATVGGSIYLSLSEHGFAGDAQVLAILPCPAIKPGRGRTVTGIFFHTNARVIDLYLEGLQEPIGVTANHPIYSLDRDDFVRAGELQYGERLQKLDGTPSRVVRTEPRSIPETVYNIEVQGDHVYRVTAEGLLAHNSCIKDPR